MSLFLMVVGGGSGLDADEEIDEGLLLLHEGLDDLAEFFLMGWERCDEGEGTLETCELVGSGDQLVLIEGVGGRDGSVVQRLLEVVLGLALDVVGQAVDLRNEVGDLREVGDLVLDREEHVGSFRCVVLLTT
jgi:hypothetical protein